MKSSIEFLHECFTYNDGKLFWKERPRQHFNTDQGFNVFNSQFALKEAGCIIKTDHYFHCLIHVNNKIHRRSILIWSMHNNKWPINLIDHKDRNTLNDKIDNLREATGTQNQANSKLSKRNKTGYKGVYWSEKNKRYYSYITVNKKQIRLGSYYDPKLAHDVYMHFAKLYFGEFASNGISNETSNEEQCNASN